MTTARAEQTHPDWSLWLKWIVATTASYAIGVAINGAMGEVVGEALGGEVLHKLGHTVGMGLFGAIVVLAQWPVLQQSGPGLPNISVEPTRPVAAIGARFMAADSANLALPPWRGFHHVALVTRDLDATMRFYTEVLGMEIMFVAPAGELHGRHCSIRPGSESDRLGLHFFEYPHAPHSNPHDQSLEATVFDPGPTFLSHISFALPNEEAGLALRERLTSYSIPMTPMMDQGDLRNMGFLDNNGMALEAIWPKEAIV